MFDERRQAKLREARQRYEQTLAGHPELAAIEMRLIELYQQRVLRSQSRESASWQAEVEALERQRQDYLRQHNIPQDFGEPQWDCALCQDTGIVEGKICRCEQQRWQASPPETNF